MLGVERVKNSDAAFYRSDVVTHSDVKTAEIARAAHQLAALNSKFLAKFHYGTDGNDRIVDMELSDDLLESLYDALVDGHEKLIQEKKKQDERIRRKFNEFQVNKIKRVKYDKPWTIVWWADGDITRSKCAENDVWSESAGFNACVVKHYFQTTGAYNKVLKTYCGKDSDKMSKAEKESKSYLDGYAEGLEIGYADGREDGYYKGHDDGYDEGFEDGKNCERQEQKEMNFED